MVMKMNSVYVLQHFREGEESEDVKLIGIFSSEEKAKKIVVGLLKKPGFKDYPDGFSIEEYQIDNDIEWKEGFGI